MSLLQATAIRAIPADMFIGLASILSGMLIGLVFGAVCWHFMRKTDRTARLSVLWLFLAWGALWIGQGLQEPIKHLISG
jgi:NhaP-type Na+/H+ or K+/H+ antiporter